MQIIAHILLGTATLTHGGLLLTARAAGPRGEQVTLAIVDGDELAVVVQLKGQGPFIPGDIVVTIPAGATEAQVRAALNASTGFRAIASVVQASGDGSAAINTLAKTPFVASGGLKQHLESKLTVLGWDDRDQKTTGMPTGFLWLDTAECERESVIAEMEEYWSGTLMASLSLQIDESDFHLQNAVIQLVRRKLHSALKTFDHPSLTEIGRKKYKFGNEQKPQDAGTASEGANLTIQFSAPIQWVEAAFDPEEYLTYDLSEIRIGLFREPLTDPLGGPGEEVKDTDIILTP
jgi:hypothetical protein